jgi:uncharacterized protein YggT (Ycf19 family)
MMHAVTVPLAAVNNEIADYLGALLTVYVLLIIAYILSQLFFGFGGRMPYNRHASAAIGFLHDVCEPYLRIWRKVIPPIGPLDLSPIVGILVLQIGGGILIGLIDQ